MCRSCLTLCDPIVCQAPLSRILEWFAISFSRDLPNPGTEPVSLALAPCLESTGWAWQGLEVHIRA